MSGGLLFLVDHCDILRRVENTTEPYGADPSYDFHLTGEPCRYVVHENKGTAGIEAEFITEEVAKFHFQGAIDIREGDIITNVVLDGTTTIENEHKVALRFSVDGGNIPRRGRIGSVKIVRTKAIS